MEHKDIKAGAAVIALDDLRMYDGRAAVGQMPQIETITAGTPGIIAGVDRERGGWNRVRIAFDGHTAEYTTDMTGAAFALRLDDERTGAVRQHRHEMRKLAQRLGRMLAEAMADGEEVDSETLGALHAICARVSSL